jgi:hypothetical protein
MRKIIVLLAAAAALSLAAATAWADTSGDNPSGYHWTDSNAPAPTVPFSWVDATGGTLFSESDCDDCAETVALPFTFNYFDTDYTQLQISTNGQLSFNVADPNSCNENYNSDDLPIPQDDAGCDSTGWGANPLIASWFDDLDPGECGSIFYQTFGSAPNRTFVVEFDDVCHNDCETCEPGDGVTFETILFEGSNDIKVQFMDAFFETGDSDIEEENNGGTGTFGLNENGSTGLQYSANAPVISDNLAILYSTAAPAPPTPTEPGPQPTAEPLSPPAEPTADEGPISAPDTGSGSDSGTPSMLWLAAAALVMTITGAGAFAYARRR